MAVASAGPYANNLHIDLHQHLISQFFTGRMLFPTPNQQSQSTEGTIELLSIPRLSIIHYPLYSSCQLFDKRGYRLLRLCWRELLMGWSYNRKLSLQSASERIWVVPCIHIGFGDSLSAAGLLECIPCCHISDKNYRHFQKSKGICLDYGAHCD